MMSRQFVFFVVLLTIKSTNLVFGDIDCDGTPPAVVMTTCCRFPSYYNLQDFYDCKSEIGNRTGFHFYECAAACALKKSTALLDDRMVLANAIKMTSDNLPATDVQYQHVIDGLKYCFEEANNRYDRFKEVHSKRNASAMEDNCNPIGAFSIVCGKRYLLRMCPDTEWQNGPGCAELRDFYNACPLPKF